jgi:flagellin
VYFHVGAASTDSVSLPLASLDSGDVAAALDAGVSIATRAGSVAALDLIDKALTQIGGERSLWGAMINRLGHAEDNAANVSLHTSASRSRIMDTDYAQETAQLARALILDQAGTAMLTQANQQPMYVLALLG